MSRAVARRAIARRAIESSELRLEVAGPRPPAPACPPPACPPPAWHGRAHAHLAAAQVSKLKQQLRLDVQEKENARENVRKLCREPPPSPLAARV